MSNTKNKKAIVIIPCRYNSTRLKGKPLKLIGDMPMMWHVYQKAKSSNLISKVYIATDDKRIEKKCKELKLNCLLTSGAHKTGTDRIAECINHVHADVIINIQGDEPFLDCKIIDDICALLFNNKSIDVVNSYEQIKDKNVISNANVVKTLISKDNFAIAFSRSPIPYKSKIYYRQLGVYGFRKNMLNQFISFEPGPIEIAESIEMYRFLENDIQIKMILCDSHSISVDTPSDLKAANNLYSSGLYTQL